MRGTYIRVGGGEITVGGEAYQHPAIRQKTLQPQTGILRIPGQKQNQVNQAKAAIRIKAGPSRWPIACGVDKKVISNPSSCMTAYPMPALQGTAHRDPYLEAGDKRDLVCGYVGVAKDLETHDGKPLDPSDVLRRQAVREEQLQDLEAVAAVRGTPEPREVLRSLHRFHCAAVNSLQRRWRVDKDPLKLLGGGFAGEPGRLLELRKRGSGRARGRGESQTTRTSFSLRCNELRNSATVWTG